MEPCEVVQAAIDAYPLNHDPDVSASHVTFSNVER
jgi:hypothetical protein